MRTSQLADGMAHLLVEVLVVLVAVLVWLVLTAPAIA
jgi:competence protein ComGC